MPNATASRFPAGIVAFFRDARWLTADRAIAYGRILLAASVLVAAKRYLDGDDYAADFRSFWAASAAALRGTPASAYDPQAHYAIEQTIPGTWHAGWAAFFYPPVFLLICLPLALLPFWAAALAWIAATWTLFFASVRPLIRDIPRAGLFAIGFPAAWMNAGGQNGLLTAALVTFAVRWMDRRPLLAGALLGGLIYKPQFGIVLPFALAAARRWRVAGAAAAMSVALILASVAAFGLAPWLGFYRDLPLARIAVEIGAEKPWNLISVLGGMTLLGAPIEVAQAAQTAATVGVCAMMVVFARYHPFRSPLGAAICVGACVVAPWLHYYDLTLLAFPLLWLVAEGLRTGFRPWEKFGILLGYALPLICAPLAIGLRVPLSIPILGALMALIWRRAAATPCPAQ